MSSSQLVSPNHQHTTDYARLGFYPTQDAARLIGAKPAMLYRWAQDDLVRPTLRTWVSGEENAGYSFEELIYLRVIRLLRRNTSLYGAAKTLQHVVHRVGPIGPSWAQLEIGIDHARDIWVKYPDDWELVKVVDSSGTGQRGEIKFLFPEEFKDLSTHIDSLLIPREFRRFIEINPEVRDGFPVIRDTSFETAVVRRFRDRNISILELHAYYPSYSAEQLGAADKYEKLLDNAAI